MSQQEIIMLDQQKISANLPPDCELTILDSTSSTNDYLKTREHPSRIHVCLAEQQTRGRGRLGRAWVSPWGKNIYLSCLYPFTKNISELSGLSLVVSLAILSAMKQCGIEEGVFVKWPNDILYANKKLAGTLIELQSESTDRSHAVIGIGLNVNMEDAEGITQPWTSMQMIAGHYVDRNLVAIALINQLIMYLPRFEEMGLAVFTHEWMSVDCLMNQTITVTNVSGVLTGKVIGVNAEGHLLLALADGSVKAVASGDTSITASLISEPRPSGSGRER